jgi:hypothetical protein
MNDASPQSYAEALDRAALMVLAALRDHAKTQFSSVQLEALRLRGTQFDSARGFGKHAVHAVFADIRERAITMLEAELIEAGVADDVGAELNRILHELLDSMEKMFAERQL